MLTALPGSKAGSGVLRVSTSLLYTHRWPASRRRSSFFFSVRTGSEGAGMRVSERVGQPGILRQKRRIGRNHAALPDRQMAAAIGLFMHGGGMSRHPPGIIGDEVTRRVFPGPGRRLLRSQALDGAHQPAVEIELAVIIGEARDLPPR